MARDDDSGSKGGIGRGLLVMAGENDNFDFKLGFDPENPRHMIELVKDLVAMANSGGGTIRIFGRSY